MMASTLLFLTCLQFACSYEATVESPFFGVNYLFSAVRTVHFSHAFRCLTLDLLCEELTYSAHFH